MEKVDSQAVIRQQLLALLRSEQAHMGFNDAVKDFPMPLINTRPPNVSYTCWHLIEHIRITQWDILDFIRNPNYVYMKWPDDYWPNPAAQATPAQWEATVAGFRQDMKDLEAIASDPATDLYTPIPHGEGQTILRELLLVADHNAYHVGELGILRQVLNAWPANR